MEKEEIFEEKDSQKSKYFIPWIFFCSFNNIGVMAIYQILYSNLTPLFITQLHLNASKVAMIRGFIGPIVG